MKEASKWSVKKLKSSPKERLVLRKLLDSLVPATNWLFSTKQIRWHLKLNPHFEESWRHTHEWRDFVWFAIMLLGSSNPWLVDVRSSASSRWVSTRCNPEKCHNLTQKSSQLNPNLTPALRVSRLNYIAEREGVVLDGGTMNSLMTSSGGDMRKAVTYLQVLPQVSCLNLNLAVTQHCICRYFHRSPTSI